MLLDKDEIEAQLKDAPRVKQMAFAVRSAMRVLPLLAKKALSRQEEGEAFWFWAPEDRNQHLLAVLRPYGHSVSYALSMSSATEAFPSDVAASAKAVYSAITGVGDYTYYSDIITYASGRGVGYAFADTNAYAAYAYVAGTDAAEGMIHEIKQDLVQLSKFSAEELLSQPLWSVSTPPKDWQQLLSQFNKDAKSLNTGFEVWLDWYEDRLQGKPIDVELLEKWNTIPAEKVAQGVIAINAYLKDLVDKKADRSLNRVRAIFIGYGEAGKTSLIRVLNNEPVVEGKGDMTAGIEISDWPVPGSDIKAHFWDFGGQVMAHATHQFFLRERCLYVLVLNARSEIDSTEQAEYWLEHVKSFGKDARVMIVGNKADKAGLNLDMSYLKSKYPSIVDYFPLSCTQAHTKFKAEFDRFYRDFCQHLQAAGTHQILFTPEQFGVLEDLRVMSSQSAFLKRGDFTALCEKYHIATDGPKNRDQLLDLLDKLGVVIHFPQLPCLDDYVLNPRWLTHGVYTLMYERKAMLTEQDVIAILRSKPINDEGGRELDYPPEKCRFIMDAMQEFKLCYPLPSNRKTLAIPELLATDQPQDIPFEKSGALVFEFAFRGFMPRNIMPELIVNRHEEIIEQIVWQRGVLLRSKQYQAEALVQVDYHERILSIWVQDRDAKDYLSLLNDEVLKIIGRLNLDYEERVELPISACKDLQTGLYKPEKVDYRQLLNSVRNGIYIFSGKHNIYDLNKVLGIIMPDSEIKSLHNGTIFNINVNGGNFAGQSMAIHAIGDKKVTNINQNISNSTVHGSIVAAEKIENSFNQLHKSKAEPEVKQLLERLLTEIKDLNAKVPASPVIDSLSEEAATLVSESSREAPRKRWYEASLSGIEEAAKSLGAIAKPVLAVVKELSPLLLS